MQFLARTQQAQQKKSVLVAGAQPKDAYGAAWQRGSCLTPLLDGTPSICDAAHVSVCLWPCTYSCGFAQQRVIDREVWLTTARRWMLCYGTVCMCVCMDVWRFCLYECLPVYMCVCLSVWKSIDCYFCLCICGLSVIERSRNVILASMRVISLTSLCMCMHVRKFISRIRMHHGLIQVLVYGLSATPIGVYMCMHNITNKQRSIHCTVSGEKKGSVS